MKKILCLGMLTFLAGCGDMMMPYGPAYGPMPGYAPVPGFEFGGFGGMDDGGMGGFDDGGFGGMDDD